MRSLTEATLIPGLDLLETTNVSVGRGTDTPFELVGAPWIDGQQLAAHLNSRKIAGVRFVPVRFTPASSVFKGEECNGVNIIVTDRAKFRPLPVGLEIAVALRQLYSHMEDRQLPSSARQRGHAGAIEARGIGGRNCSFLVASVSGV